MLLCQNLCGGHNAGLVSVTYGYEGCEHRHHRLAGTHVSLKQTVHLAAAGEVGAYFLYDSLLRAGQLERQGLEAGIEVLAHLGHRNAVFCAAAHVFLLEKAQLEEEQFFELEPVCRL